MTDFERSLPMILNLTLDAIMPAYRDLFTQYDLTEPQWRVLRMVWNDQNITSAALSEKTLLSPPSLVSIIDRLEKKGLVSRVRSLTDRRQVYVVATAKGRALHQEVMPHVVAIHEDLKVRVSDEEWAAMETILNKIRRPAGASNLHAVGDV
ncbi:MAG: MarR family transcriptional regulator [Pseudomonadota bacterium]